MKNIKFLLLTAFSALLIMLTGCSSDDTPTISNFTAIKYDGYLSIADNGKYKAAGTVMGTKGYTAGGYYTTTTSGTPTLQLYDKVSIIDFATGKVSKEISMNRGRANMVSVPTPTMTFFAGGAMVEGSSTVESKDILILASNGEWKRTDLKLSEAKNNFAGATTGNRVLFAGGYANGQYLKSVDILNASNPNDRSSDNLEFPRAELAAAAYNNWIFLAGGKNEQGVTDAIQVFDVKKGYWVYINNSMPKLSEARSGLSGVATNGRIIFAGGETNTDYSRRVDIFNIAKQQWSEEELSEARTGMACTTARNLAIFAGGKKGSNNYSNSVDVYNTLTDKFVATLQLREARAYATALAIGNRIYIVGGIGENGPSQMIDIFELK